MTITTYSELKTAVANWIERNDLTAEADEFIDLCEAEMQRELKLQVFETTSDVTITAGAGLLPTGFTAARSVYWSASPNRILRFVPPDMLNSMNASDPSTVNFYSIVGQYVQVADNQSGTLTMLYTAKFVPLDSGNPTNSILTNHPAAYLYGSLAQAAIFCKDFDGASAYRKVFEAEVQQIRNDNIDKKFVGQLAVRVA
jgi:hypothetical protein